MTKHMTGTREDWFARDLLEPEKEFTRCSDELARRRQELPWVRSFVLEDGPAGAVRHMHHHAYACWDSEETRHFYEDILGMPLIATIVLEDPLRTDGSMYCHTFFEIADGSVLAFFEHTSLVHPKKFTARSSLHRHVALDVGGSAMVRQFKCKLDAAGIANVLMDHGACLSLRCDDPNGLILELAAKIRTPSEYQRTSRASARSELQQWLYYRQNWWRNAAGMG